MKTKKRNCILCGGTTNTLFKIKMPVFMGVKTDNTPEHFNDMSFDSCNACGEVQIGELLDLGVLYQNNHNINVVGETWKQHYIELAAFAKNAVQGKTILEISDPSAKIAKLSHGFKNWYIVEPNPQIIDLKNVFFINGFFDENFHAVQDVDVIIHSHLLEHMHDPVGFFRKCNDLLKDDGTMIISVPDMEYILDQGYSPNNILHFEHTYYLNSEILNQLSNRNGFKVIDSKRFNNHSIFYKLRKEKNKSAQPINLKITAKFKTNFKNHIENIKSINTQIGKLGEYRILLFGAHVSSQFYIFNGLNVEKIDSIIDNDPNKEGKLLYGTNLRANNPNPITKIAKCAVICSHTGIYKDEIVKQLLELNQDLVIL